MTLEEITDHSKYLLKTAGLDETIITHIIEKYSLDLAGLLKILELLHDSGKLVAFCAVDNNDKTTLETVLGETPNLSRQTLALEAIQAHLTNLWKEELIDILTHPKLEDLAIILGLLKDHITLEEVTSLLTHQNLQKLLFAINWLSTTIARNCSLWFAMDEQKLKLVMTHHNLELLIHNLQWLHNHNKEIEGCTQSVLLLNTLLVLILLKTDEFTEEDISLIKLLAQHNDLESIFNGFARLPALTAQTSLAVARSPEPNKLATSLAKTQEILDPISQELKEATVKKILAHRAPIKLLNFIIALKNTGALNDPDTIAFLRANPTALTNFNNYNAINLQTAGNDWSNLILFLRIEIDRDWMPAGVKETLRNLDTNTLIKIKASDHEFWHKAWDLRQISALIDWLIHLKENRSNISKYVALAVTNQGPGHWSLYFSQVTRLLETVGPEVTGQEMIRAVLTHPNLLHLSNCLNALTELPTDTKEAALKVLKSIIAYRPTNNFTQASLTASALLRTHWGIIAPKLNQGANFTTIARVIHYMTREMDDNESDALTVRLLQDPTCAALFTPAVAEALEDMQYIQYSEIRSTRECILRITPCFAPVTVPHNSAFFPGVTTLAIRNPNRLSLAEKIQNIVQQKIVSNDEQIMSIEEILRPLYITPEYYPDARYLVLRV